MSSFERKTAAAVCFSLGCSFSHGSTNDLLQHELWGLNNTPRIETQTPSNVDSADLANTGTCAQRPNITGNTYTCETYLDAGVEDMDINFPEGLAAYIPSPSLNTQDVVIALIDTGIDYNHPDLIDKIWLNPGETTGLDTNNNGIDDGCEDTIDGDNNGYLNDCHGINAMVDAGESPNLNPEAGDPIDNEVGHGTNMAGVFGAVANNANNDYHGGVYGVTGFEPKIRIATCKSAKLETDVFPYLPNTAAPAATEEAIRKCLWYFYELKQSGINIAVINASGGLSKFTNISNIFYPEVAEKYLLNTPEVQMLVGLFESINVPIVSASGNFAWNIDRDHLDRSYYPAAFKNSNIISVAAIDNKGDIPNWSSWGRWSIDLVAPGDQILSSAPTYPIYSAENSDFIVTDGTSQSTAYVTGIVALLKANSGTENLDAPSIRRLLMSSGKPLNSAKNKTVSGSLVRLADSNGKGALTCNNQLFKRRQLPEADTLVALPGSEIVIEVQNYNCANASTDTSMTVTVLTTNETFSLFDDGQGEDIEAGDGIYSGSWIVPYGAFEYVLSTGIDTVKNAEDMLTIATTLVVDNSDDTSKNGVWWPSNYRNGYYGNNYKYATASASEKLFTWSSLVNDSGYYEVYARWPDGPNFATNATFRVHHQSLIDGSTITSEVSVDQTTNGGQWMSLGSYWFASGTQSITLTNLDADGSVVADAVQWAPLP